MGFPVPLNNTATDTIVAKASDGSVQDVGSLTVTIDNYSAAYVAKYPAAGTNGFIVVPRPGLVGTITVTVTAHATDLKGNVLPNGVQLFDLQGTPAPPLATSLVMGNPQAGVFPAVPTDPGSSTATLV